MRILGCLISALLLSGEAKAESYWDMASRMASEAKAYAEATANEAYEWAASEAEYAGNAMVEAASSTAQALQAAAGVAPSAAPYTRASPSPRPTPISRPKPDVTTTCPRAPLPSEDEASQGIRMLEVVKVAGSLDCEKVARAQGLATSLTPLRIPHTNLDLTPISATDFQGCKMPAGTLDQALESAALPLRCAGNAGYGLFVDGAWGDAEFLAGLAGAGLREGARAMVGGIPLVGDDLLHELGMRTYGEIGADAARATLETLEKASAYLDTPQGRQKLEVMMCYGTRQSFRLAAEARMLRGLGQMLVDGLPGAAEKLAEMPCREVATLGCRLGGMIGYEFVSDALLEAGAVAAAATGVGAAAGAALGVGAVAKTLNKIAARSAEAALELFSFMMKLIPANLLVDLVKGLEKVLSPELYALVREASGLSDEALGAGGTVAAKKPRFNAEEIARRKSAQIAAASEARAGAGAAGATPAGPSKGGKSGGAVLAEAAPVRSASTAATPAPPRPAARTPAAKSERGIFAENELADQIVEGVHEAWSVPIPEGSLRELETSWRAIETRAKGTLNSVSPENMAKADEMRMAASGTATGRNGVNGVKDGADLARRNWQDANDMIHQWSMLGEPLTVEKIKQLNRVIGRDLPNNGGVPGSMRTAGEEVMGGHVSKMYLPGAAVEREMDDFVRWYAQAEKSGMPPIELAARSYQRLVSIHPFKDGNGRTTRMVMDWILQNHGLPPATLVDREVEVAVFGMYKAGGRSLDEINFVSPEDAVRVVTRGVERTLKIYETGAP